MEHVIDYDYGISAIDSGFLRPRLAAVHLIVEGGRAALVDTAVNATAPRVLEVLAAKGLRPEQVDFVILTHVHLDHAGGAGLLMQRLPNARLTVHRRGVRHMADPSRLIAGTVAVYGEAATRRMYGDILPVSADRIIDSTRESSIRLNGRELVFLDTPGHARHHTCILDGKSGHIFSGDTFGLSYRELDRDDRQFVFPTTTPVQFDPDALHRSVDLLMSYRPRAIYVTHFGRIGDLPRLAADLHRLIDAHAALGLRERDAGPERGERLRQGVEAILFEESARQGWRLERERLREVFATDIELNAQGISAWLDASAG